MTEKKTRLLCEDDVIKAIDKHTKEDGTLDNDISCILEEVTDVVVAGSKDTMNNLQVVSKYATTPPMPPASNKDRICDTCVKADVCAFISIFHKAVNDIKDISKRVGLYIDTDISCQKWVGKISDYKSLPLCPEVDGNTIPRCIMLKDKKYCTGKVCR